MKPQRCDPTGICPGVTHRTKRARLFEMTWDGFPSSGRNAQMPLPRPIRVFEMRGIPGHRRERIEAADFRLVSPNPSFVRVPRNSIGIVKAPQEAP
jgi:hypothetical protein